MLDPKTPPNFKLWKPERKKHTAEHACDEIVQMCQGEIWLQKNHITSNAQHAWSRQGDECTMMALHKMQAENASWQIFFFQHHRSEAHTRRTWQTQRGWRCWDKIMGVSIFVEEKLVEAAAAAAAATACMTLHAVCCTQSFYPLLWGSKLTQQIAFTMSKHVETALGVFVQVLLLAGWLWLASVKKQQNPTDSNHCASDTESVWSSGVTSNYWEHFLSSCQLQTQTSRWVQEEEHRKHKGASHVPDRRRQQQQQQDESSLNSTLLAACLSMAWIWFPCRAPTPQHPTWLQM